MDNEQQEPCSNSIIESRRAPSLIEIRSQNRSLAHLINYENYQGAFLGQYLRLQGLIRSETHCDVHKATSIFNEGEIYEARAYTLRGVSSKERMYRVRNLKKRAAQPSFLGSLEQGGRKWLVFSGGFSDLRPVSPELPEKGGKAWRDRIDFERSFPRLPRGIDPPLCFFHGMDCILNLYREDRSKFTRIWSGTEPVCGSYGE